MVRRGRLRTDSTMMQMLATALLLAEEAGGGWLGRHWPLLAACALVLGILLMLVMLARYLRIAINLFLDTPLPVTANLHDYEPPEGEIVAFPSLEGRHLRGMFIDRPPGPADKGTVIFCHEFASDMMSAGRYARPLVEAGYTVFTFDFRGHGESFAPPHFEPRHWPSNHDVNDILAAIAYVESHRETDGKGVGVLGISRGASAAVVAAALSPSIRCLALDGAFSTDFSIDELMRRWAQIFVRIDLARADRTFSVYRFFRALTMFYVELKCRCRFPSTRRALVKLDSVPILFIHGERDAYVRPEQARVLFDLKPGAKELWICPGAKHNQSVATEPQTYARKIVEFFDRHLAAAAAPPTSATPPAAAAPPGALAPRTAG
ncbi:MAG: alpha/beta fold hydrolase [Planctomycetes bacterium]|nr:alpha/beta fold hydrolase [Planctomycetota bacterium]